MKKQYQNPLATVAWAKSEDILTLSLNLFAAFEIGGEDERSVVDFEEV